MRLKRLNIESNSECSQVDPAVARALFKEFVQARRALKLKNEAEISFSYGELKQRLNRKLPELEQRLGGAVEFQVVTTDGKVRLRARRAEGPADAGKQGRSSNKLENELIVVVTASHDKIELESVGRTPSGRQPVIESAGSWRATVLSSDELDRARKRKIVPIAFAVAASLAGGFWALDNYAPTDLIVGTDDEQTREQAKAKSRTKSGPSELELALAAEEEDRKTRARQERQMAAQSSEQTVEVHVDSIEDGDTPVVAAK